MGFLVILAFKSYELSGLSCLYDFQSFLSIYTFLYWFILPDFIILFPIGPLHCSGESLELCGMTQADESKPMLSLGSLCCINWRMYSE